MAIASRMLSCYEQDYIASVETRLRFASTVQKEAAKVADKIFAQIFSERGLGLALFMVGGTGARNASKAA